jgi:hypothetical protein
MCTARLPEVDWTDAPTYLNGFVRFVERRNLVSARVPSHFKRSLQHFASVRRKRSPPRRSANPAQHLLCLGHPAGSGGPNIPLGEERIDNHLVQGRDCTEDAHFVPRHAHQSLNCSDPYTLFHCATSRKFAGSVPDGVIAILHCHNPSGRTMALGLTQAPKKLVPRIFPGAGGGG